MILLLQGYLAIRDFAAAIMMSVISTAVALSLRYRSNSSIFFSVALALVFAYFVLANLTDTLVIGLGFGALWASLLLVHILS